MLQEIEKTATQPDITNTPSKIKSLLLSPDTEQQLFQNLWRVYIRNVHDNFKFSNAGQRNDHRCQLFFVTVDNEIDKVLPAISQAERIALREEILEIFANESNNGGLVNFTKNFDRKNYIGAIQESVKNFFRELDELNGRIPSAKEAQNDRRAQFEQIALLHHQGDGNGNGIGHNDNQLRENIDNLIQKAQYLEV